MFLIWEVGQTASRTLSCSEYLEFVNQFQKMWCFCFMFIVGATTEPITAFMVSYKSESCDNCNPLRDSERKRRM